MSNCIHNTCTRSYCYLTGKCLERQREEGKQVHYDHKRLRWVTQTIPKDRKLENLNVNSSSIKP